VAAFKAAQYEDGMEGLLAVKAERKEKGACVGGDDVVL
jgi:hypothetical protein